MNIGNPHSVDDINFIEVTCFSRTVQGASIDNSIQTEDGKAAGGRSNKRMTIIGRND